MALGISHVSSTETTIKVKATGFSSAVVTINWYIDNAYDGTINNTDSGWPSYTFRGLDPGTEYRIKAAFYDESGERLDVYGDQSSEYTDISTEDAEDMIRILYHDGEGTAVYTPYEGYVTLDGGSLGGSWTFLGWATKPETSTVTYEEGDRVYASEAYETLILYAVYEQTDTITFWYGENMEKTNSRTCYRHRLQIDTGDDEEMAYDFFYSMNISTLPKFASSTLTTTTGDVANLVWEAIGWSYTESAGKEDFAPGYVWSEEEIYDNRKIGDMYAVYKRTVTISYLPNGGSGSMSSSTGVAYYNTSGDVQTATVSLSECTFMPPDGQSWAAWCPASDGSGNQYTTSISTSYDILLYAIWGAYIPSLWEWKSTVAVDQPPDARGENSFVEQSDGTYYAYYLTAAEWIEFIDKIEEVASCLGVAIDSDYVDQAKTGVVPEYGMCDYQFNGAQLLIKQIGGKDVPALVTKGNNITAAQFNELKDSLNNLIKSSF